jgi:hypothetical protein
MLLFYNGLQMKWGKTANPRNPQIYFYSCKFSYLELEPDKTAAIFMLTKS